MELIHIANATFPIELSSSEETISLENLASKQKLSGLLKSSAGTFAPARKLCLLVVEPAGIEPATFWLQTRRSPS